MRPKITAAALACAALQACASTGAHPPGTAPLPGLVVGVLTSAVEGRPYTAAELASPGLRAGVERCERVGMPRCREDLKPKDRRTSFTVGVDPKVVAMFSSTRLTPGAAYRIDCRLLDPGGVVVSARPDDAPVVAPPTGGVLTVCEYGIPTGMRAGRWAVELAVNGQPLRTLLFDVLPGLGTGEGSI